LNESSALGAKYFQQNRNLKRGSFVKRICIATLAALLPGSASYAQLTRGSIIGSVQDPTTAVVANAAVRIVNNATRAERRAATNQNGF
jgi:hypothetical protein